MRRPKLLFLFFPDLSTWAPPDLIRTAPMRILIARIKQRSEYAKIAA